ncbi:MAG: septal ring lytic transglycosylase RlpA family protein [Patescibacteria group bacterium]
MKILRMMVCFLCLLIPITANAQADYYMKKVGRQLVRVRASANNKQVKIATKTRAKNPWNEFSLHDIRHPCFAKREKEPVVARVSWYGDHKTQGKTMANGDELNPSEDFIAIPFRNWQLGSCVRVTRFANAKSIIVTIKDRGPCVKKDPRRIGDLSKSAMEKLGGKEKGIIKTLIEPVPDSWCDDVAVLD